MAALTQRLHVLVYVLATEGERLHVVSVDSRRKQVVNAASAFPPPRLPNDPEEPCGSRDPSGEDRDACALPVRPDGSRSRRGVPRSVRGVWRCPRTRYSEPWSPPGRRGPGARRCVPTLDLNRELCGRYPEPGPVPRTSADWVRRARCRPRRRDRSGHGREITRAATLFGDSRTSRLLIAVRSPRALPHDPSGCPGTGRVVHGRS